MTLPYLENTKRVEFERDDESGRVKGPDGTTYDTEAAWFYFSQFGLCGCGDPERVHEFLLNCMAARSDEYPNIIDVQKVQKLAAENNEIIAEFIMHYLDSCDLIEHGSSVYGSWLTDRGKQALEIGPMKDEDGHG